MKDNITLLAAATGGFMLSIAVAGILRAAPVTSWQVQPNLSSTQVAQLQLKPVHPDAAAEQTLNQIKKLEFELAQKQYEDGEISKAVLDQKAASYRLSEQELQKFGNSFGIADS